MRRVLISPKTVNERRTDAIDFAPDLSGGQSIVSAIASAQVYSGTSTVPLSVSATVSGTVVNVDTSGGTLGVVYWVRVIASTTLPTASLVVNYYLAVAPDVP